MDPDLVGNFQEDHSHHHHHRQSSLNSESSPSSMATSTAAAKPKQSPVTTTTCLEHHHPQTPTFDTDTDPIYTLHPETPTSPATATSSYTSAVSNDTFSAGSNPISSSVSKRRNMSQPMSLSSTLPSNMSELLHHQSSGSDSTHTSSSKFNSPSVLSSRRPDTVHGPPRQISLVSFLHWLKEHPSSSNIGSENLARFLMVKSVSLIAACLGCIYGVVFDRQPAISICSALLLFLPALQGATGATRFCGLVLSLALATIFLSFQTRSMPLVGPSLESTLLFGLPLVTGMLVGRRIGLATCLAVLTYSVEEYRSKTMNSTLTAEESSRMWAGFGAYWVSLVFIGSMTSLYQWCVEVCVRDANLFKDIAVANAKSKDGVVSSVSHELRTPLAALIGWTELLMSDQTLSSSALSTVSMLHSSTLSLLTILNALLDVSKVSAAKMTNCNQNFNLHDLVLDTARMMTGLSGTRTVELLVDFNAQVPELVRADPGIIKQVLGNLISNAIKFTDVGYVNVGVSLKEEDDDTVTVEFVVQDTGKGIADEQKDKLFVEFSQVEGGRCKTHEAGTGLGLFLVKNLVEVMNGTVFVSSKLGVGSTFGFVIKMEKQYLAFRTPGYDHVVTVSSAFQAGIGQEISDPTSPILPVTPGLAQSTTPLPTNEPWADIKMTPVSTPKDSSQAGDYFALLPSEVTRANANNITLRTRDHAFLSNRQYYLHSQCGYFEDFLWNTATARWRAQGVRRLAYEECIHGWHTDFGTKDSLAPFGDIFLIDLSPTTNRPRCAMVLTDQEHTRLFLSKLSQRLITRARSRIGAARQASVILFYPFGHPPSLAQEPLLTLGQYYQISLCRKPVSERALGSIIMKQVVAIQAGVGENDAVNVTTPTQNQFDTGATMATTVSNSEPELTSATETSCESIDSNQSGSDTLSQVSSGISQDSVNTSVTSTDPEGLSQSRKDSAQSSADTDASSPEIQGRMQASHVRFAKRNGSAPKLALDKKSTSAPAPNTTVEKSTKRVLKRPPINPVSKTRPGLVSKESIQDINASGKRILVVDDNPFNSNLLFQQLAKLGVSKVDQASSGKEAVEMFKPGVHALVLMDLKMPIMNGFEATVSIREKEKEFWGPGVVAAEPIKGIPIQQQMDESWFQGLDKCPWSPERFLGPAPVRTRRSTGGLSSASSLSNTKDQQVSGSKPKVAQAATIIAVTADWTAEVGEDREKAMNDGFDDVMVKPISLPSLSVLLERYMDCRK